MADGEEKEDKKKFKKGETIKNELPPQWKPSKGSELEGYYRGWKMIHPSTAKDPFKIHILQLDEDTILPVKAGEDGVEETQFDDGEVVSLSGKILDRLMSRVRPDTYVWITYNGKTKVGKGKAHAYDVTLPQGVQPLPEIMDSDKDTAAA